MLVLIVVDLSKIYKNKPNNFAGLNIWLFTCTFIYKSPNSYFAFLHLFKTKVLRNWIDNILPKYSLFKCIFFYQA